MRTLALSITLAIGLLHVYIMILEMFLWSRAAKVFAVPRSERDNTLLRKVLQNLGAYNGVLAAGLLWAWFHPNPAVQSQVALFFLIAVAAMGLVGAATSSKKILVIQTIPAVLGIVAWILAG